MEGWGMGDFEIAVLGMVREDWAIEILFCCNSDHQKQQTNRILTTIQEAESPITRMMAQGCPQLFPSLQDDCISQFLTHEMLAE